MNPSYSDLGHTCISMRVDPGARGRGSHIGVERRLEEVDGDNKPPVC